MGLLAKFLQLFNKNEQPKIAETSIVGFDTSLVYIPKYKSLSEVEKKKVDKIIKESDISSLEDIIYYGKNVSDYSTGISEILLSLYYKLTEEKTKQNMSKKDMLKLGVNSLITNEQIIVYQNMLKDLEKETTFRTIALEQMYKKWKTEHKMSDVFSKDHRLKRQQEKNSYEAAIERMKISKKVIEEQLQVSENTYNSNRNACRFNKRI